MRLLKVAPALLVSVSLLCIAQTKLPNTPAGRQCAAWLESFNRGDPNAHREFLQKNWPSRAQNVDRQMEFRQRTGGFDLKRVEESSPTKLVVLVQEHASDQFVRLMIEVQA